MDVGPENQAFFDTVLSGVITPDTATQLPATTQGFAILRGAGANTGTVTIGSSNAVASLGGFTLKAGEQTPLLPVANLNQFWALGSAAGQKLEYLMLK